MLAAVLLLSGAARVAAQEQTTVGDLAELLAAEDRREFDGAMMSRAAQHPDSPVRLRAAMSMGRIGDPLALPLLTRLLQDPDTSVRVEAAFAMGRLGDRAAVAELSRQLDLLPAASSGPLPKELVTALCKLGGPEADAAIVRLLQRHPPDASAADAATSAALLESWRLGRRSRTAALLPEYVRRGAGDFRLNAVYAAGRMGVAAAAPYLLDAAGDPDVTIRMWALRGLTAQLADSAQLSHGAFVDRIRVLLDDADAQVRINALRALATFADSSLVIYVVPRLIDRDPNVPVQAAATLGALGGSRAAAALTDKLVQPGPFGLQRALLVALAQCAPDSAVARARTLAADRDWRQRFLAAEVFGTAGAPGRTGTLALLGDADPRVVAAALGALGRATEPGDSAVLAAARAKLASPDVGVRSSAIELVGREHAATTVAELVQAYQRAAPDRDSDARLSAINALAELAQSSPSARASVEAAFFGAAPRSTDYVVRRAVAQRFGPAARRAWGAVLPVETGRSPEDYREAVRRYLLGAPAAGSMRVTIETDRGNIVLQLHPFDAPLTVDNFVRLIDRRYFDNGRWHRVVPNFVIQDGDPRGDGSGGPGYAIRDEINRWRYDRGVLGMALSGPDTGGSQFFITHSPQPHLDGGYTVFGHVVSGFDALDHIVQGDRIRRIFR